MKHSLEWDQCLLCISCMQFNAVNSIVRFAELSSNVERRKERFLNENDSAVVCLFVRVNEEVHGVIDVFFF